LGKPVEKCVENSVSIFNRDVKDFNKIIGRENCLWKTPILRNEKYFKNLKKNNLDG
jgi:hypothetical protein